jgi:hypothetical protein
MKCKWCGKPLLSDSSILMWSPTQGAHAPCWVLAPPNLKLKTMVRNRVRIHAPSKAPVPYEYRWKVVR